MTEIANQTGRSGAWRPADQTQPPDLIDEPVAARWSLASEIETERPQWFNWTPVAIGTGALIYFQLVFEPPLWLAWALILMASGVWLHQRRRSRHGFATSVLVSLALLTATGFVAAKLRTEAVWSPVIEKRTGLVEVAAFVELIEPSARRGQRLTLRPYRIGQFKPEKVPSRVRIRVLNPLEGMSPGTAIVVKAKLSPPASPALPGGFDFARHAWFQKIGAVGYALARPTRDTAPPPMPTWLAVRAEIEAVRRNILKRVHAVLQGQTGAISAALIMGERGGISEDTNKIYRDAGLFHVLSISGMHMAIMAGTVFFLARLFFAAVPSLVLRYPLKKWAAVIAALGALAYLLISGSAFATVRSYLMITVMFFAVLVDRPALALRNVALAALILLLLFPESVLDPGFQMSFAAVTALVSAYEVVRRRSVRSRLSSYGFFVKGCLFFAGLVLSTFVAGLAVAPIAAYHFHTTQHFAVLANVVAMPVSNIIIMPAALLALVAMPFGLEAIPLMIMGFGVDMLTQVARHVAELPGAIAHVEAMPNPAIVAMAFGMLWLML